jgi:hypothetical protein
MLVPASNLTIAARVSLLEFRTSDNSLSNALRSALRLSFDKAKSIRPAGFCGTVAAQGRACRSAEIPVA